MATIRGTYQETNIDTIASMITLIDAHMAAENARMIALGGAATSIIGTITFTITAEDGANNQYNLVLTTAFNCPAIADFTTLTAAMSVYATAVETESDFTTVVEVDVRITVTLEN